MGSQLPLQYLFNIALFIYEYFKCALHKIQITLLLYNKNKCD